MIKLSRQAIGTVTVAVLAMALIACSSSTSNKNENVSQSVTPNGTALTPETQTSSGEAETTLDRIMSAGKIKIGYQSGIPPWGYIPEGESKPAGIDVDLANKFGEFLNVDVELSEMSSANKMLALEGGKVDMLIAGTAPTPEKEKVALFSLQYFGSVQKLLVRQDSSISGISDLGGMKVAVTQGGFEQDDLESEVGPQVAKTIQFISYSDFVQGLQALIRGEVDTLSTSTSILTKLQEESAEKGIDLKIVGDPIGCNAGAAGVFRLGDEALRDKLNEMLTQMAEDESMYKLQEKWFPKLDRFEIKDRPLCER